MLRAHPGVGDELNYPSVLNYGESVIILSACLALITTVVDILQVHQFSTQSPCFTMHLIRSYTNLYALRMRFGLRDKPCVPCSMQLLVSSKPTVSFKWTKQVTVRRGKVRTIRGYSSTAEVSFLMVSAVWKDIVAQHLSVSNTSPLVRCRLDARHTASLC
jgi:hypothetical protein